MLRIKKSISSGITREKLGYDFDVVVGDTVYLPAFDYANTGDSIFKVIDPGFDSTLLNTGKYRKNYFYSSVINSGLDPYVVEGIGTQRTAFPNLYFYDPFHQSMLYCLRVNGEHIFGDTLPYPLCDFTVNIDEYTNKQGISISPNPCSDYLLVTIAGQPPVEMTFKFYSLHGIIFHQLKFNNANGEYKIDVSGLPNGFYILSIKSGKLNCFHKKIFIQH